MGFKIRQKVKGAEVKIIKSENPTYLNKFGIIQRISINRGVAYVKLNNENIEVEIPLNDLIIP